MDSARQSSLEGIISSSSPPLWNIDQRAQGQARFYRIIQHFETVASNDDCNGQYNQPKLVRLTYDHARSEASKDMFLQAFFHLAELPIEGEHEIDLNDDSKRLGSVVSEFADYLFDNLFLPLRASSVKTPQLSPLIHSAVLRAQGGAGVQHFVGTPERVAGLRGDCLIRDRYRCVISRRFEIQEAAKRLKEAREAGREATDNDGNLLRAESQFEFLEVAHILPHSLTKTDKDAELHPSKKAALHILNMFDNGMIHLIEGSDIDRPRNAITLIHSLHGLFGSFDIFFEPIPEKENTYRIQSFLDPLLVRDLPVVRTLFLTEDRNIEPPSLRLLALHSAIGHILHLSGAGEYIDSILRDAEWKDTSADGSTQLGHLVSLKLHGWLDQEVH
ncbi:hypothetical protein B0T21DRAFT_452061 [Apiosordaria backusii]|uniref:HNH nuclease domain-containing protein n=1 Tax=Apiosordaria backusii TaxID=314023 RepID=A0AA40BDY2_9PEZI|nr:hypothetical protein B0T21DRAFT_452061 [Apiosordaria backusii]